MSGQNRDLNSLKKEFRKKVDLFMAEVTSMVFITEAWRSIERQKYLYSLWRTRAGNKVTRTLKSKHIDWLAIAIAFKGDALYPSKSDARRAKLWDIAKKYGIVWGGSWKWKTKDYPHFEDNWKPFQENMWNMSEMRKIMEKEVPESERLLSNHSWEKPLSEADTRCLFEIVIYRNNERKKNAEK